VPFLIELYKAWNKLHDPSTDGALQAYNYCGDEYGGQFDPHMWGLNTSANVETTYMALLNK
jgi:hypothetical protein